jgi:hypothetical protein
VPFTGRILLTEIYHMLGKFNRFPFGAFRNKKNQHIFTASSGMILISNFMANWFESRRDRLTHVDLI